MVTALKNFIEENIDLIEQKKWKDLYDLASVHIPFQIGNLTTNLMYAGSPHPAHAPENSYNGILN